jgi:hypothetical protein
MTRVPTVMPRRLALIPSNDHVGIYLIRKSKLHSKCNYLDHLFLLGSYSMFFKQSAEFDRGIHCSKSERSSARKLRRWSGRVFLLANLTALALITACGGGGSSQSSGSGKGQAGGFSNANLKGNYTYGLIGAFLGTSASTPYQRRGTFIADGNGHITAGVDDLMLATGPVTNMLTGSYAITADGTGLLTLDTPSQSIQLAISLVSSSTAYIIEFDPTATGNGAIDLQNTAAFTKMPAGTLVFRYHAGPPGAGGTSTVAGNLVSGPAGSFSGNEDFVRAGVTGSATNTGTLTASDMNGKGQLTIIDNAGVTSDFFYYVVDSNNFNLMGVDPGLLSDGRMESQAAGPFGNSSMKGSFVFRSSGDTPLKVNGADSVGVFTADGQGNVASGSYDSVQDGTPISAATMTGSYSLESSGRVKLTLNPQGTAPIPEIVWLVSPTSGFFFVDLPGTAQDGRLDQQSGSFSAASLSGPFGFDMFGYDAQSPAQIDRAGIATFDGKSALALSDYFVNRSGSREETSAPNGSYTVKANGRVSGSISGVTNAIVIYLVSGTTGYLILEDPGAQVFGDMAQQTSP